MLNPNENRDIQSPSQELRPEATRVTPPREVNTIRTANKNRIATLLVIGAMNALGAAGAAGCGGRAVVDDQNTYDNPQQDAGTDCDGSKCLDDGGSKADAGPDGCMGIDGGPDGCMGVWCNNIGIKFSGPEAETLAKGTTNVPALCVSVKNGCFQGSMNDIVFETEGTGDKTKIEFALAYPDGSRITEYQTGSNDASIHTFKPSEFLNLYANSERTVCLYANIAADAATGSTYSFKYYPKLGNYSNGASLDGVPDTITGNTFMVGGPTIGSVYIGANAQPEPLTAGQNGKISSFAIQSVDFQNPNGGFTEDSDLTRLSLSFSGSCDHHNISNIALYAEGNPNPICGTNTLWSLEYTKNLAHITCATPYKVPQGSTRNFYVTADQSCPMGTYIETSLAHPSDLFMNSHTYDHGEQVTGFDGAGSKGGVSHVDIK